MDAADELSEMIQERLGVLNEINASTFASGQPTNAMSVQRWIDDVRGKVTRFNLKAIKNPDNPLFSEVVVAHGYRSKGSDDEHSL